LSFAAFAQTFEVASIKPSDPNANGAMMRPVAGGIEMKGFNLKAMIVSAWRVQPFQITGGPNWVSDARFDIMAKSDPPAKPADIPIRLRKLLQDRFQLVVREETREMPVYELVLARKDGKLGPKMIESQCPVYDADHPAPPQPTAAQKGCGGSSGGPNMMRAKGSQMQNMAQSLVGGLERTVIDKTGLKGLYDVDLKWSNDPVSDGGPSIFTALEEQLGLKLVSSKGPVQMLVIERAEKPTEN
jgi:uncharacterized protein (TIGR03435 family)